MILMTCLTSNFDNFQEIRYNIAVLLLRYIYIFFFVLFSCDARRHKVSMNSVTRISKRCPIPQQLKRSRIGRRRKKEGSSYFFLEIAYVDTLQTSLVVEKLNHSINVCSIIGSQNYFSSKLNFLKSYIKTKFCSII